MVKVTKKAFAVIGKEGSTLDGEGFIQKLWKDANDHFGEIAHLAKKGASGALVEFGVPCPISLAHSSRGRRGFARPVSGRRGMC